MTDAEALKRLNGLSHWIPVNPRANEYAKKVLKTRIERGESPKEILQIDDEYYINKVAKGLVWLGCVEYYRITKDNPLKSHLFNSCLDRSLDEEEFGARAVRKRKEK